MVDRNDAGGRIGEPERCEPCRRIGVATVGVVDGNNSILCGGRNREEDSDQSLLEQQAICLALRGDARNVVAWTCCSIDQTKDRIGALAILKPVLHALGADCPAVLWLKAAKTSAAVSPEICEECVFRRPGWTQRLKRPDPPERTTIRLHCRNTPPPLFPTTPRF